MNFKNEFIDSVSSVLNIETNELNDKISDKNILDIIHRPKTIFKKDDQIETINNIKKILRLYGVLKYEDEKLNKINNIKEAINYMKTFFEAEKEKEKFIAVFLNNQNEIIMTKMLSEGTTDNSVIYPKEVLKSALNCYCTQIIFAHNHPSGNCNPSDSDICVTQRLLNIFIPLEIRVVDHIIIANNNAYSFASERGNVFTTEVADYNPIYLDDENEYDAEM